jgi:H+/Cl- antiporter ClcA
VKDVYHKVRPYLSIPHWRGRLVLWTAAAGVGVAAVGFAQLADTAPALFRRIVAAGSVWPRILSPLGLFAIAWVTRRHFKGAEGSGIPQTIFALRTESEAESLRSLSGA